ncbi:hypothetical protein Tco_0745469, partial [Tanacetum coccineum]
MTPRIKTVVFNIGEIEFHPLNSRLKNLSGILDPPGMVPFHCNPSFFPYALIELYQSPETKFQSEWSPFKALLWRGRTTIGSPRSPDIPYDPINSSDGLLGLKNSRALSLSFIAIKDFPHPQLHFGESKPANVSLKHRKCNNSTNIASSSIRELISLGNLDTDIQEKEQKESQKQQIQARNGKDKVK